LDDDIDLRVDSGLGADYEVSTVAYKLYQRQGVPDDENLLADLDTVLQAYDRYLLSKSDSVSNRGEETETVSFESALRAVITDIERQHFVFEPWQVAAFVAAVRTKPFVILAGISGTGKTKLPSLIAQATGALAEVIPVRPDWTDSSDILGYVDLQGTFRPGVVLECARRAMLDPEHQWFCVMDEMNLARVELYFAELLSRIEDRQPAPSGGFESKPLLTQQVGETHAVWSQVPLPANLAVIGTVNMDESSHGFSRKVLDRAFTLEFSDIDLNQWDLGGQSSFTGARAAMAWPARQWFPRAITLGGLVDLNDERRKRIQQTVDVLTQVNGFLVQAQLQVGYRTRDEVGLFVLQADELEPLFVTRAGDRVDPLDLALHMKVLPRIIGGSGAVRRTVLQLLGWSWSEIPIAVEEDSRQVMDEWVRQGRGGSLAGALYPRTAARLCLMWERLTADGFTSFWL
jgi:hypothetical protein